MRMKKKSGDTLVEVMFAVGIFSMVVISSVTVMNGGTKSIQQDLEITMTRNEIDAQAEALRFIQSSYVSERSYPKSEWKYANLWKAVIENALDGSMGDDQLKSELDYHPEKCEDVYRKDGSFTGDIWKHNGFVLNYRNLYQAATKDDFGNTKTALDASKVVYRPNSNDVKMQPTTLYPRLLFEDNNNEEGDKFYSGSESNELKNAEGLYVVAVKDKEKKYYDFYIRSCWQSSDKATPTLTSTVIRLYNPCIDGNAAGCENN